MINSVVDASVLEASCRAPGMREMVPGVAINTRTATEADHIVQ
jgi:hypothetical protein